MADVMIDLETLGTRPDCVILTLGAVKFDPYSLDEPKDGLYFRLDVDEQIVKGRDVNEDTLAWWGKQAEAVREEALGENNRISVDNAHKQLNKFLVGVDSIWAQGPVFDIVILENLYRQYGWPAPWQYWQIRDCRTLFGVHGDPRSKNREGHHDALADCIYQAQGVQQIYSQLNIQRR